MGLYIFLKKCGGTPEELDKSGTHPAGASVIPHCPDDERWRAQGLGGFPAGRMIPVFRVMVARSKRPHQRDWKTHERLGFVFLSTAL